MRLYFLKYKTLNNNYKKGIKYLATFKRKELFSNIKGEIIMTHSVNINFKLDENVEKYGKSLF